ncbi:MAG: hypothetical protein JWO38_2148 [Gemmataceae bacterium]|nr:hypothetical protein [Gemmataceae bacterium]
MRFRWLVVGTFGVVGCQTLLAPAPKAPQPVALPVPTLEQNPPPMREGVQTSVSVPAAILSVKGDAAAAPSPTPADDPLTLAAECLVRGDQPTAAAYLDSYVRGHPDQLMFRAQLAELLLRIGRLGDAKGHFERFCADAQDATGPPKAHLVHCHTRLMEIGQRTDDRFAEVFHRGVGLLVLVQGQGIGAADEDEDEPREEVLCQAIKALAEAAELRPTDPRAQLYLADAYDRAGSRRAADRARATARNLTGPGALTPAEVRRLALAPGGR